jgi:lipopolysaccharide biosynthesis protein
MKSAIILHLYYHDLWPEFKEMITALLNENTHLYVSVNTLESEYISDIKKIAKEVHLVENRGMDIGPFLLIYKKIRGQYSVITKIHTKKSIHTPQIGESWRKALYTPLLQHYSYIYTTLTQLTEPCMIGVKRCALNVENDPAHNSPEQRIHIENICKLTDTIPTGYFIAGTMFTVNDIYMNTYFSDEIIDKIYNMFGEGYIRDNSPAHAMERIFGYIATQTNLLVI